MPATARWAQVEAEGREFRVGLPGERQEVPGCPLLLSGTLARSWIDSEGLDSVTGTQASGLTRGATTPTPILSCVESDLVP